ncbi:hypothetical protein F442_00225 [Phytophthora nicotianae P10297]|uniref:Uncharacterized protein n=4 Tax=Phytophthora nicotianae TaxID=4792 RepID=V9G315_PHYNI|nr:hypothetical protein F443_00241 [Phytophthora nicotianae P1569]ETP55208.1 hypothetical protein F442_00225 [Phytophthora nicotianae P10297]
MSSLCLLELHRREQLSEGRLSTEGCAEHARKNPKGRKSRGRTEQLNADDGGGVSCRRVVAPVRSKSAAAELRTLESNMGVFTPHFNLPVQ